MKLMYWSCHICPVHLGSGSQIQQQPKNGGKLEFEFWSKNVNPKQIWKKVARIFQNNNKIIKILVLSYKKITCELKNTKLMGGKEAVHKKYD